MNRAHWGTEGIYMRVRQIRLHHPGIKPEELYQRMNRILGTPLSDLEKSDIQDTFYKEA